MGRETAQPSRNVIALSVLGIAFVFAADEFLGFDLPFLRDGAEGPLNGSYAMYCVVQCMAALALVAMPKAARLSSTKGFLPLGVAATLISATALYAGSRTASAWAGVGLVVGSSSTLFLRVAILDTLLAFPRDIVLKAMTGGFALLALASPLFCLTSSQTYLAAFALCSCGGFLATRRLSRQSAGLPSETGQETERRTERQVLRKRTGGQAVVAGFIILVVAISYLNPLPYLETLGPTDSLAFILTTHLAGAALFFLLEIIVGDESYASTFKVVSTLVLTSFVLLGLMGMTNPAPYVLCAALNSLIVYTTAAVAWDMAATDRAVSARSIAGCFLVLNASLLLGVAVGSAELFLLPQQGELTALAAILAVLVTVAALWFTTERNLTSFFWGRPAVGRPDTSQPDSVPGSVPGSIPGGMSGGNRDGRRCHDGRAETSARDNGTPDVSAGAAYESVIAARVAEVAAANGLTPREQEILSLMVLGRSSSFIAEQLCVSNGTVRKRFSDIYAKCGVHSKQELITLVQIG